MKKEDLNFILDVLQEKNTDYMQCGLQNIDWVSVLGFLNIHRIGTCFLNRAKKLGISMPAQVKKALENQKAANSKRNSEMSVYIRELAAEFEASYLQYAFLKGSLLTNASMFYPYVNMRLLSLIRHPDLRRTIMECSQSVLYGNGERTSNDIDILVKPSDISKAGDILNRLGYIQGTWDADKKEAVPYTREEILSRRMNRGETAPFIKKSDSGLFEFAEIDINFSTDHLPGSSRLTADMIDGSLLYTDKSGSEIRGLDSRYNLIHLILHLYKEATVYSMVMRNKACELYKYYDIYLIMKKRLYNEKLFINSVEKYGIEKEVYFVLYNLAEIFDTLDISNILNRFRPSDSSYLSKITDPATGTEYSWNKTAVDKLLCFNDFDGIKELIQ